VCKGGEALQTCKQGQLWCILQVFADGQRLLRERGQPLRILSYLQYHRYQQLEGVGALPLWLLFVPENAAAGLHIRSQPFWDISARLPLAALVQEHAATVQAELAQVLEADGSFKQVGNDPYMRERMLKGFLPNARELCQDRHVP